MFNSTYQDALSVLNELAAIHRVHRNIVFPSGTNDDFYSIIQALKVIGISKTLELSGLICPPLIFYSPEGLLCLSLSWENCL